MVQESHIAFPPNRWQTRVSNVDIALQGRSVFSTSCSLCRMHPPAPRRQNAKVPIHCKAVDTRRSSLRLCDVNSAKIFVRRLPIVSPLEVACTGNSTAAALHLTLMHVL